MDLRVFFYRKFVAGQGRERSIARKFLEKNEKNRDPILRMCRGRGGKKHLLCHIGNVGASIARPRLSKKVRSPLGPLCEGAPPAGGGGENCAVARNISGYGKVLSLAEGGFSTLLYIAMFLLFLLGWLLQSVTNRSAALRHSVRRCAALKR